MKARLLKKLLNDTSYIVHDRGDHICVGVPYVPDAISVNKATLKVGYAIDTFNHGRDSLINDEQRYIWDRLHELIESGEIRDIIEGEDEIENSLFVYKVEDGKLIETTTDEYGWPNVTKEGWLMHDNEFFKTKLEAVKHGIENCDCFVSSSDRRMTELQNSIDEWAEMQAETMKHRNNLIDLKVELEKTCGNCGAYNEGSEDDRCRECVDGHRKDVDREMPGCEHFSKRVEDKDE